MNNSCIHGLYSHQGFQSCCGGYGNQLDCGHTLDDIFDRVWVTQPPFFTVIASLNLQASLLLTVGQSI
uniref:Uncharacterized protein n=1 Tax=Romanomermis culicivorax TaxID=13658 RepID=A0A915KRP7_ROMCU